MKMYKNSILVIGIIAALIVFSFNAAGETINDSTGDVFHYKYVDGKYSWEAFSGSKPSIDITKCTYTITGSEATVTFTTSGAIEESESVIYSFFLVSSDEATAYTIMYGNGNGMLLGGSSAGGGFEQLDSTVSGNTFTTTFDISDPNKEYSLYGFASEYTDINDEDGESWQDWVPGSYAPWYTGGEGNGMTNGNGAEDGGGGGTPGFEALAVIAALGVAFIILRRKK